MKFILVLLLILAMCFGVMHSCDLPLSLSSYRYENADRYTAGECTLYDDVQRIEIDWISGNVTVQYHDEDYIAVSETASRTLDKDNLLHYWLDGDTLRIRFAKSSRFPSASLRDKELTLLLPQNTVLRDLSIETISADMHLQDITADHFDLEAVSGNISVTATGSAGSLDAETVSGNIFAAAEIFRSIDLDSTSGRITVKADSLGEESGLESTSGHIELHLADDGFTARTSTLSGRFESDFPYNKADGVYICGSGGPEIDIETVSGNVSIFTKR